MTNPVGRPMKYRLYIEILNDKEIHTPATIVNYGIERGLMSSNLNGEGMKRERLRIRHTLA